MIQVWAEKFRLKIEPNFQIRNRNRPKSTILTEIETKTENLVRFSPIGFQFFGPAVKKPIGINQTKEKVVGFLHWSSFLLLMLESIFFFLK